jgi:hypothetical protein
MSIIGMGMDLLLAVLLCAALVFGWRLEKKLRALKNGQEAFAQAVRELDGAARRAESGLAHLREATDEAHDSLHDRILKARELKTQLDGQIARAERLGPIAAPREAPRERDVQREPARAATRELILDAPERPRSAFRPSSSMPMPAETGRAPRRFDDELFQTAAERIRGAQ